MLQFFRHIRQRLFLEKQVSRYFGYAIGEIALIVVGILLALQVSEWNQDRRDRNEETLILGAIDGELSTYLQDLEEILDVHEQKETALKVVSKALDGGPIEDNQAFLDHVAQSTVYSWGIKRLTNSVFTEQVSSGKLILIRDAQLRRSIYQFYAEVAGHEERTDPRTSSYGSLAYELIPRRYHFDPEDWLNFAEFQVKDGLKEDEYATIARAVLDSDLRQFIGAEQNRSQFLKWVWQKSQYHTIELRSQIEAYLAKP